MPGEEAYQEWSRSVPVIERGSWSKTGNTPCPSSKEGFYFAHALGFCFWFWTRFDNAFSSIYDFCQINMTLQTWSFFQVLVSIKRFFQVCLALLARQQGSSDPAGLLDHQWVTRWFFIPVPPLGWTIIIESLSQYSLVFVASPLTTQVARWRWPSPVQGRLPGGKVSLK